MAERKFAKKGTRKSTKTITAVNKKPQAFTGEERAAMNERAQELKAEARRGSRAKKADGESDVLAKIAEMPESDRAVAERLHAIVKASGPTLSPRTWYARRTPPRLALRTGSRSGSKGSSTRCAGDDRDD